MRKYVDQIGYIDHNAPRTTYYIVYLCVYKY